MIQWSKSWRDGNVQVKHAYGTEPREHSTNPYKEVVGKGSLCDDGNTSSGTYHNTDESEALGIKGSEAALLERSKDKCWRSAFCCRQSS